jgi:hypothetical protein
MLNYKTTEFKKSTTAKWSKNNTFDGLSSGGGGGFNSDGSVSNESGFVHQGNQDAVTLLTIQDLHNDKKITRSQIQPPVGVYRRETDEGPRKTHRPPHTNTWNSSVDSSSRGEGRRGVGGGDGHRAILYLSFDLEADGPVPGIYSMLSLGLCAFDIFGQVVWEQEYNLEPLPDAREDENTMAWWRKPEQAAAWAHLAKNRQSPEVAMKHLMESVQRLKINYKIVPVAWPACFDWMFLHWYMHKFVGYNPLGRTARCGVTYCWAVAKTTNPNVDMDHLLKRWSDPRFANHTHRALDDAREQGARFVNMLREVTRKGHGAPL